MVVAGRCVPCPSRPRRAPGIPQTRYGRPNVAEPATEPFGATQQVPAPASAPPASAPPASAPPASAPPASAPPASAPPASAPPASAPPAAAAPAPGVPIAGGGGALPSRAARSEVAQETSILAGPSFDGFSAGRRGVREEETEAFHHPARQSGAPSRPRHAAQSETGEHPTVGTGHSTAGDEEGATSRFMPMRATDPVQAPGAGSDADEQATTQIGPIDPDATTRLGAPSAAEQAERRAAFARGEAERRANAQADLEPLAADRATGDSDAGGDSGGGSDEPPTSPWSAPPRDRT